MLTIIREKLNYISKLYFKNHYISEICPYGQFILIYCISYISLKFLLEFTHFLVAKQIK